MQFLIPNISRIYSSNWQHVVILLNSTTLVWYIFRIYAKRTGVAVSLFIYRSWKDFYQIQKLHFILIYFICV